jgi:iron complex outermembrane receptor protein
MPPLRQGFVYGRRFAVAACLLTGFHSQSMADSVLDEITVTAQKREQSIQDVGIAITAFSGKQLREMGVDKSTDIAAMTPGLYISGNNGGQKELFTIRGVTQNDFNDSTEAPVAVYVDDGYVAFGQGQVFGAFDLDRVEVLKGPQGTLFGRNATGGLVQFVSNRPTDDLEGYADLTYGSYHQIRIESAISGPLSDAVSARAAMIYSKHDPYINNCYPCAPYGAGSLDGKPVSPDHAGTGDEDTLGVRGELQIGHKDETNFLLIASYARTIQNSAPFLELPTVAVFDARGNHVNTIVAGPNETAEAILTDGTPIHPFSFDPALTRPPGGNLFTPSCTPQDRQDLSCSQAFSVEGGNTSHSYSLTGKLTRPFGSTTLTSVTDYKHYDKFQEINADGGPESTVNALFDAKATTWAEELRLNGEFAKTRWVVGAYYLNIDITSNFALAAPADSLFVPLVGVPWTDAFLTRLKTQSGSLFGQVERDLTDSVTLIGGARLIKEKKDFSGEEDFFLNSNPYAIDTGTLLFNVQPHVNLHTDNTLWSGKLQLDWHATDKLLLYGGVNRGVKAGGFNSPTTVGAGFPAADIPYGPEVLIDYETGFKQDGLLGGTTRLNGAFFLYDYQGYQGFFFDNITGYVKNLEAKYKGLELELASAPVAGLDLSFNVSYLNARVYNVQLGPGVFRDSQPSFAPRFHGSGLVRYRFPFDAWGGTIAAQASTDVVSYTYDNINNFDTSKLPAYAVTNLRLSWQGNDGHWQAAVFSNNIADRRYYIIGYDLSTITGSNSLAPGLPRWFGVNMRYSFK